MPTIVTPGRSTRKGNAPRYERIPLKPCGKAEAASAARSPWTHEATEAETHDDDGGETGREQDEIRARPQGAAPSIPTPGDSAGLM